MQTEKRYQVFVSSTYLDLRAERQAVVSTLLNVDAFPSGMELFPATDDDAWTLIREVIAECDYYLLIIGGKYGSVDKELDISYTEREFDAAVELGKPVMAFLHGDPGQLPGDRLELGDEARKKLDAFRAKVKASKHVVFWASAEDLAGKVALTWNKFTRSYPAVGWIRADQATNVESLERIAKADREIEQLKAQLDRSRTEAPDGTTGLAQGAETFKFRVEPRFQYQTPGQYPVWIRVPDTMGVTWDWLFRRVGLAMMTEVTEEALRSELSEFILDEATPVRLDAWTVRVRRHIASELGIEQDKVRVTEWKLKLSTEIVRSIILQFDALGLIAQSERKRSVSDKGSYWTLTPYGRTRLVQIRALRSGEIASAAADDSDSEGGAEVPEEES